jgi:hypothetical protein
MIDSDLFVLKYFMSKRVTGLGLVWHCKVTFVDIVLLDGLIIRRG